MMRRALLWFGVAALVLYSLFPFYFAFVSSMKSGTALFRVDYWPRHLELANYKAIFEQQPFGQSIANSLAVACGVVALSLTASLCAAYSLSRFQFRGRSLLLACVLAVSMFPQVAILSGMFQLIRALGLYNNRLGLAVSYLVFTLPFTVWMLTTFMRGLPKELEEAAVMDGASHMSILVRVFMPLLWPALVTTGLLAFIAAWNEFLFALTFTLTNDQRTVPVSIALMSGASQHELPWGNIMAASVTVTAPLVLLVLIFQRRIVSGLTAGAIKG
jgi:trehalose/maltose transport system permease protein